MLAEVEDARRESAVAAAHRREAGEIVEYIANHMPSPDLEGDLHRFFLALPAVQTALNA